MTQFLAYDGVDLGVTSVRLEDGVAGFTEHADGTFGVGGIRIEDPTAARTFIELQQFTHDETACAEPRTFTGFLTNMRIARGPYIVDGGRVYDFDLMDLNYLLHLQPLRGATAKRPVETGDQRLTWLLSSVALEGIVFDNGLVGSNPNLFDEADYTRQYADDVLADLCVSSSLETGRIFFVYANPGDNQPSLFIDLPTATTYTSDLSISNVLADSDGNNLVFEPYRDFEAESSGEDIYCSVFFVYKTGFVFRHNQTTHDIYFSGNGYHRQAVFETSRVGSLSTATRHADAYLANHAGTIDTYTGTVRLPKEKVNLIRAGQRVATRLIHIPGLETSTYLRVSSRTVLPTPITQDFYDVHLTLSNRSITPTGGGPPPGSFPQPPAGSVTTLSVLQATSRQSIGASDTDRGQYPVAGHVWTLPTAGNLLLLGVTAYDNGTAQDIPTPSGWTAVTAIQHPTGFGTSANYSNRIFYKVSDGTETPFNAATGYDEATMVLVELDGNGTLVDAEQGNGVNGGGHATDEGNRASAPVSAAALSTTAGEPVLVIGFGALTGPTGLWTTTSGAVLDQSGSFELGYPSTTHLGSLMVALAVSSSSGAERLTWTMYDNNNFPFWGVAAFRGETSATDSPPGSAQDTGWIVPTFVADGEDFTWQMPSPFAPGSLEVRLDGMDQTGSVTATDPLCGQFTVPFQVQTGERLEARALGM